MRPPMVQDLIPLCRQNQNSQHGSDENDTALQPMAKNKPKASLIESVWTSTFEPYQVRRLRPKKQGEREAYDAVRRNRGACDKHRRSKSAVSIPLRDCICLHFLIYASAAAATYRILLMNAIASVLHVIKLSKSPERLRDQPLPLKAALKRDLS